MRKYLKDSLGGMFPFGRFEELGKQNMAFLEHAMRMWAPFKMPPVPNAPADAAEKPASAAGESLDALKAQMNALQQQLEQLAKKKEG
jgi:polyhydroxyalkanoate synthesis regulator protein